ncbi:MAG TPA: hypothetical protein VN514_10035 [Ignavibacteria bacterium]|nr:hypothetical protein [Ignavibacteria bacterium]
MKKLYFVFAIFALFAMFGLTSNVQAQNGPVLYFCEKYGADGEEGISDRFSTGYLTVMVKCDYALGLSNVSIQFDKLNMNSGKFEYYKKFEYKVEPSMKYIYFAKNKTADMSFDTPGVYRVFLLDDNGKTVTSGLIEIIR